VGDTGWGKYWYDSISEFESTSDLDTNKSSSTPLRLPSVSVCGRLRSCDLFFFVFPIKQPHNKQTTTIKQQKQNKQHKQQQLAGKAQSLVVPGQQPCAEVPA